jgi:hypothetical protein
LELLCYVEALVYHARPASDREALRQRINAALRDDRDRLEVDMAWRTMAEEDRHEERIVDRKRTLLDQLRLRWGTLPAETEQVIEATQDADKLAEWLRGVITARDLDAVGIIPPR